MNKEFDFDKIGKQMPYTTPDGFFDHLEEDIWKEVKNDCQKEKPAKMRILMRSMIAVAASIALLLVINMNFSTPASASVNDVDQAFSQLTTDDQAYLLNIYQEDVFINE